MNEKRRINNKMYNKIGLNYKKEQGCWLKIIKFNK